MERRAFLRGAGTTLLLPWLASALPARAAVPAPPRRLLFWFVPNGLMPTTVTPSIVGPDYDLTPVLEPLAGVRSRVSVINGLENRAGGSETFSTHEQCTSSVLTDTFIAEPYSPVLAADISVDQYAARVAGATTPFPSLVLAANDHTSGGAGLVGIYLDHISWAGPRTPVAPITSARTLFDRLFAGDDPTATAAELERRARLRKSVLDAVTERTRALEGRLDAADRATLDRFTTGVRELELRIDQLADLTCARPEPPADDDELPAKVAAMNDLMVLALQCDHTRFVTFMVDASSAYSTYPWLGVSSDHHSLSHSWVYSEADAADLARIHNWHVAQFADLCGKLAAVKEDGGDLLSSTMTLLVTEFGDSNLHVGYPLPMLLAGGEAGGVAQGRHRVYDHRPHADLLGATLQFAGVDPTGFGQNLVEPLDLSS